MNNETRVISKNKSGKKYARNAAKALLAGLILLLTIIPQTGCGSHEPVSGSDVYLDTQCDITVFGMKESEAQEIITGAFGEIASYESHLSRTIEGSDVDRVNHAEGKTVTVDSGTAEAILAGLEAGKYSNGDFDITIGRVTALWDFKSDDPSVPAADEIKEAVATVDYRDVDINNNEVTLKNPRAELDLGGIAKGFVADRTADYLEEQGVTSGIVNLGGNVVAIGVKDDDTPFVIGVERPYSDRTEIIGSIPASDQTVVTSGIYERKFEQDGKLYLGMGNGQDFGLSYITRSPEKLQSSTEDLERVVERLYGRHVDIIINPPGKNDKNLRTITADSILENRSLIGMQAEVDDGDFTDE